jgi:hypothetical protein
MRLMHALRARALLAGLALVAVSAAPAALDAQTAVPIPQGGRIRIASAPYTGSARAAWANDDSLILVIDGRSAPVRVPVSSINTISVQRLTPRATSVKRGAMWGLAAGSVAFLISHIFVDYGAEYPTDPKYTSLTWGGAAVLYLGGGTAVGALYGAVRRSKRWETTEAPMRVWITQ